MVTELGVWEDDGGASALARTLNGTISQVEWAERIKARVGAEFDRVAAAFHAVAQKQNPAMRAFTEDVVAILEDKRAEVMRNATAGYFIQDWQDINDQVRQMIFSDLRYQAIRNNRNRGPLPSRATLRGNYEQEIGKAAQTPGLPRKSARQDSGA